MKYLALVFLFGLASAAFVHEDLDDYHEGLLDDYYEELIVSQKNFESFAEAEQDMKTELGKQLKQTLDRILSEIKDTLDHGKSVSRELIDQARDLLVKLKNNGLELEERTKSLLQDVKERVKSWWKEVLDKLNLKKDKQEVQRSDLLHKIIERFGWEKHLQTLQEMLTGNTDTESIKAFIKEKFPRSQKLVEMFIRMLGEGREKFQNFLDRIINKFRKNE